MTAHHAANHPIARIAMWSGPRNISTALMRSWGSRSDTMVCDEPLYAYYLRETGRKHPGREIVLAEHETDPEGVIRWLTNSVPDNHSIFYQKHMAHHLLPEITGNWILELRNAFLIRDPREMLTSLIRFVPSPVVEDTGLPQQWELFKRVRSATGTVPPVIRARDVLTSPHAMLSLLCDTLGVPFDESMLEWKAGPRDTDGVWAKYWYSAVYKSTGFRPYRPKSTRLPDRLKDLFNECREIYEELDVYRLRA